MNFWDKQYSAVEGYKYGTRANAFLMAEAHRLAPHARILVPGDGEGRNGVWLASQGHDVLTVDLSEVGVARARALAREHAVRLDTLVADLKVWTPPAGAFDAVVLTYLHMPPAMRTAVHRKVAAALRPIATISAPATARAGSTVTLTGSPSLAADGRTIAGYAWAATTGNASLSALSGVQTSFVAPAAGAVVVVRLTVTDDLGRVDATDASVNVSGQPPVIGGGGGGGGGGGRIDTLVLLLAASLVLSVSRRRRASRRSSGSFAASGSDPQA